MKQVLIPSLIALASLTLALPGWAQRTTAPQPPDNARFGIPTGGLPAVYQDYLFGVVSKIKSDELVLDKTKYGVPQTIHLDRKTKYIHNGKRSSLSEIKVGDPVYVDVKTDKKTGSMFAKKVVSGVNATRGSS
jgi:hypothetical protein